MRIKAFGYVRVSGKGQVKGHGLTRQRDDVQRFAGEHEYDLVQFFEDTHTGTEADRPAFVDMLATMLGNGVRVVIVESLDRLARDLMIQTQLLAKLATEGITLIAANTGEDVTAAMQDDPMRKAMIQIQGVFAELDKSLLVRKLRKGREKRRDEQGKCEGRKAFGEREGEQDTLRHIIELRRNERSSYDAIAKRLNEECLPTRSGRPWSGSTVGTIIARVHQTT
jgi:site-specific DNA recombinase